MKPVLLICTLLFSASAFAQDDNDPFAWDATINKEVVEVPGYKTWAYVNGIRLDSIDAPYANLTWSINGFNFDYGQQWKKRKEVMLTDEKGKYMILKRAGTAAALNLLHFNGWEMVESYNSDEGKVLNVLLKKRQPVTMAAH